MTPPSAPSLENLQDVRAKMPNYLHYKDWQRRHPIEGIALDHSQTPDGTALTLFRYQVETLGWAHGSHHYVIHQDGVIAYTLSETIPGYHATLNDPADSLGLEYGQYWNNRYVGIVLIGDFNAHLPTPQQMESLWPLLHYLIARHQIPVENVRGHRELAGTVSQSPGLNLNPAEIRRRLQTESPPEGLPAPEAPQPAPGEHALILADADRYLTAALGYIWKFGPEVSFSPQTAAGRWPYLTVVGPVDPAFLADYRLAGAKLVQHIPGPAEQTAAVLDELSRNKHRFAPLTPPQHHPEFSQRPALYTVQPGDTLSNIAQRLYGEPSAWQKLYAANRDSLQNLNGLHLGLVLRVPD